ncbi:MAG: hypothetical protein ACRDRG_18370 [Pseudonocardiaceae bacterium]
MSLDVAPAPRAAGAPQWFVRVPWAGSTTPERLRRVAAGLVAGCLLIAVVSMLGGVARADAVHESRTRIAALTAGAAELYRSLADADATATSGYVSGGREPAPCGPATTAPFSARPTGSYTQRACFPPATRRLCRSQNRNSAAGLHGARRDREGAQSPWPAAGSVLSGQCVAVDVLNNSARRR